LIINNIFLEKARSVIEPFLWLKTSMISELNFKVEKFLVGTQFCIALLSLMHR